MVAGPLWIRVSLCAGVSGQPHWQGLPDWQPHPQPEPQPQAPNRGGS